MSDASANLLAITPALREARLDWLANERKRIEEGFEWAPAAANARKAFADQIALAAQIAQQTMGGGR